MSKIAFTIRVYSFYLFLMGLGMMLIPNLLLSLFGFAETTEIWIRMLGLLSQQEFITSNRLKMSNLRFLNQLSLVVFSFS
jgi:hypothetical protein